MRTLPRMGLLAVAALAPLALTSTDLTAQEEVQEIPACTASVLPVEIPAGQPAFSLSVTLSEPVGLITSFDGGEGSGLKLAAPEDLPRVDMAAEGEPPRPIEMSNDESRLRLWLNTVDVEPGAYDFALLGSGGECTGTVTVVPEG